MWDFRDLRGCGTALVTPFHSKGEVDEAALRRLVTYQLQEGIDFLVPCGTTGESPTLGHEEYLRVISLVVKEAKG
ncbi:MAG: dihydrodipicolinate synthase family protein, partial [Acidobacteriota bacterium]